MPTLLEPFPAPLHELKPYKSLSNEELSARIEAVRREFGPKLLILGHHYQQDEVIALCDLRGDSYQLSQMAADSRDCRAIAFCGVHFMAETADILANRPEKLAERGGERVTVVLPDMAAGCSMADMAAIDQVESCWEELGEVIDTDDITPVTYINSAASLKAFCGRHGGIVCTSSNAAAVLEWAFERTKRVLFFPDQHLGRNTAKHGHPARPDARLGIRTPSELGGNSEEAIDSSRVLLWKGHCSVHQMFRPEHVDLFRAASIRASRSWSIPNARWKSSTRPTSRGSTGKIIRDGRSGPAGHEVGHRHRAAPGQSPEARASRAGDSLPLAGRLHVRHDVSHRPGASVLEPGEPGRRHAGQRDRVDDETARWCLVALERMLEVK